MGMHGNEYIRVAFGKDDNPNIRIDKLFRVYSVSNRQKSNSMDSESYVIHFCSDELLLSEQYKISKSYNGKGVSQIVNDVLTTYLKVPTNKYNPNNIEQTKGVYSIIIPNLKPFEAINMICLYAQSATNIGADMLFFENAQGYNLASLQSMFEKAPYYTYEYRPKNISMENYDGNIDKEVFNVLGYELINSFNVVEGISSGMFANRLITIDPMLRDYRITDFNYIEYQNKAKKLNANPIVNNLENRFGKTLYQTPEACLKLAGSNSGWEKIDYIKARPGSVTKDIFVETFFSQRKSQINLANYTRMKLYIAGDPNVTVGTTINFNMLSQDPASSNDPKQLDKYYSGKYLVTAVRHMIQTGGYNTIIEVVKDSLPEAYLEVDNSRPIFKNTVAGVKN
ncbi:MAG: hypothetical protein EBU90_20555 [Proteobacteria bacterium]|nr:hypothetical protein [Pseudomonadota bacterium]